VTKEDAIAAQLAQPHPEREPLHGRRIVGEDRRVLSESRRARLREQAARAGIRERVRELLGRRNDSPASVLDR
jgi:hypothetical protein